MAQQVALFRVKLMRTTPDKFIHPTMDFVFEKFVSGTTLNTTDVRARINGFFGSIGTGASVSNAHYLSNAIVHDGSQVHTISGYDVTAHLDGKTPTGAPFYTGTFPISWTPAGTTKPLPDQCAIALRYNANHSGVPEFVGNTRPASRYRGRIYFGPLNTDTLAALANDPVVSTQCMTDLTANFMSTLASTAGGFDNTQGLVVWSRADATIRQAIGATVDSLHDVRRRRVARRDSTRITNGTP